MNILKFWTALMRAYAPTHTQRFNAWIGQVSDWLRG